VDACPRGGATRAVYACIPLIDDGAGARNECGPLSEDLRRRERGISWVVLLRDPPRLRIAWLGNPSADGDKRSNRFSSGVLRRRSPDPTTPRTRSAEVAPRADASEGAGRANVRTLASRPRNRQRRLELATGSAISSTQRCRCAGITRRCTGRSPGLLRGSASRWRSAPAGERQVVRQL
jgi:hypothetical protein